MASPSWRVSAGISRRKWWTEVAIAFTWPGVPVTAWATMRPLRSKRPAERSPASRTTDRKSTRLNSSHTVISYAVFCLKKKKKKIKLLTTKKKKKKITYKNETKVQL